MGRGREPGDGVDEDPMIRKKFETELSRKALTSIMPEDAYRDRDYEWDYGHKLAS